jgi:hypothetical protein
MLHRPDIIPERAFTPSDSPVPESFAAKSGTPSEDAAHDLLVSRGYQSTWNGGWELPSESHNPTADEIAALGIIFVDMP